MNWQITLAALAVIAACAVIFAVMRVSGRAARAEERVKDLKQETDAHDRINKADIGRDLSDSQRVDRLRAFADKHGKR